MTTIYQRLIAMRECLRQVQNQFPVSQEEEWESEPFRHRFICNAITHRTNCSEVTKEDTRQLIQRGISFLATFDDWMSANNNNQGFSYTQMIDFRKQWIDQLCRDITTEIYEQRPRNL